MHYTCCYDEIKGTQDLKIYPHTDSFHDCLTALAAGVTNILIAENDTKLAFDGHLVVSLFRPCASNVGLRSVCACLCACSLTPIVEG